MLLLLSAGEWLREPGLLPALATLVAALLTLGAFPVRTEPWSARLGVGIGMALVLTVGLAEYRRSRIIHDWPARQADLARTAGDRAVAELDAVAARLARAAREAASVDPAVPERAFARMERLLPREGPEAGLVILDAGGNARVWSGRHVVPPGRDPAEARIRRSAFYVVLEVQRQRPDGGQAVASALLEADTATPSTPGTVAGRVQAAHQVAVRFDEPARGSGAERLWPAGAPLVAVRVLPPSREDALAALLTRSDRMAAWLAVVTLLVVATGTSSRGARYLILGLLPWLIVRVPLGQALGLDALFSPASFFSPLLGPFSHSAGALAVTGTLVFVLAVGLWHAALPRAWIRTGVGLAALLATPYIVREFARGITPPAAGVPTGLWLVWHLALLLTTASLLIVAAGLLRGRFDRQARARLPVLGAVVGLAAGVVGILVFTGRPAWPAWYTALWVPAVLLVTRPAPTWATVTCIGLVAGAGASLMTWGAAIAGRTDVAVRDIGRLGREPDALAEPLLLDLAGAAAANPPATAADLYRLWRGSSLREQGYPARLLLADSLPVADVRLDDLSLPDSLLLAAARPVEPWHGPTVARVVGLPGIYHLLTAPVADAVVLVVATGPRSARIEPAPLGRVLETGPERTSLYRLTLAPVPLGAAPAPASRWRREGWALRTIRPVTSDLGAWEAHAVIPLGRPGSILVRGGLVVLLDVAVLALLWLVAERLGGVRRRPFPLRLLFGSYQGRLAVALGVFFIAPAALLAAISISQLAGEARQSRDLVLERILRDAVPSGGFPVHADSGTVKLPELSRRVDADLALYLGGHRLGTSEPLLADLGVFPALLDADAHHALRLDGERFTGAANAGLAVRTGYAVVEVEGRLDDGVLATVAPARERAARERQEDVAYTLVLVTLLGVLAALTAARGAARALSRPVADLRRAALAFGRGEDAPLRSGGQPREFTPVFEAFGRMAADVRTGQAALEAARRRTEAVLATVSTGVVALDAGGRVLLANARAEDALGVALGPGARFSEVAGAAWRDVVQDGPEGTEVEAGGRRYEVRMASLPPEVGGLVLAINDVTEATRAARILAWADVANQVAHAIKNPLTPLRLGIQHLQRVREQRPDRFDEVLQETSSRILAEIERLDAIARAFARFAAPAEPAWPIELVDCGEVAREVAALYHLAPHIAIRIAIPDRARVPARRDELTEVLLNLCDNARNAGATGITIRLTDGVLEVQDDGRGIAPEHVPLIFEPRFSTTSSGSGLGLAVVRRLVESWNATIDVLSAPGQGTTFRITFRDPEAQPAAPGPA